MSAVSCPWECRQCGEEAQVFIEGACSECHEQNQRRLDEHNARFDWWEKLSDRERGDAIKRAK